MLAATVAWRGFLIIERGEVEFFCRNRTVTASGGQPLFSLLSFSLLSADHLQLPQPRGVLGRRHRRVGGHRVPERRRGVLRLCGGDELLMVLLHLLLLLLLLLVALRRRRGVVSRWRRGACHLRLLFLLLLPAATRRDLKAKRSGW